MWHYPIFHLDTKSSKRATEDFVAFPGFYSHDMVFNNEHNSYSKMSVKLSLTCSQAMLFISVDKRYTRASASLRCYLVYMIWYFRWGVIINKTKHWWHNRTNTFIIVSDITWNGYKYKHQPQGSHQVNTKNIRLFYIILNGLTNWMNCIHVLENKPKNRKLASGKINTLSRTICA
jgi:hypothetical protein